MRGSSTSARAIAMRWRCPPENSWVRFNASCPSRLAQNRQPTLAWRAAGIELRTDAAPVTRRLFVRSSDVARVSCTGPETPPAYSSRRNGSFYAATIIAKQAPLGTPPSCDVRCNPRTPSRAWIFPTPTRRRCRAVRPAARHDTRSLALNAPRTEPAAHTRRFRGECHGYFPGAVGSTGDSGSPAHHRRARGLLSSNPPYKMFGDADMSCTVPLTTARLSITATRCANLRTRLRSWRDQQHGHAAARGFVALQFQEQFTICARIVQSSAVVGSSAEAGAAGHASAIGHRALALFADS